MPIRMTHPKHGFTHAYNNNEKAYLENLGWREEKPEPVEVEVIPEVSVEENVEDVADEKAEEVVSDPLEEAHATYFEKFGKKAHHNAKLETILKALNDNSE